MHKNALWSCFFIEAFAMISIKVALLGCSTVKTHVDYQLFIQAKLMDYEELVVLFNIIVLIQEVYQYG